MNLINWLLNPKIHVNKYFEFLYGNTKQYDFLCIFERLGYIQLKNFNFFCLFYFKH
jgi:hypothetical protein